MIKRIKHQVIIPLYLYVAALFVYYLLKWLKVSDGIEWDHQIFNFLVFVAPFLVILVSIYLYRKLLSKRKEGVIFLLGAMPGFIPGALFGYGLWGMGHGDTVFGFLIHVLIIGLPTALIFGVLGSIYDYLLDKLFS